MKFSIKQMLFGMIGVALVAAVAGAGANGSPLAYGLAVSIALAVLHFAAFAIVYWIVWFVFVLPRFRRLSASANLSQEKRNDTGPQEAAS